MCQRLAFLAPRCYTNALTIVTIIVINNDALVSGMWDDAQRDGRPAEYRWRPLQKFRNSIPCTTPQSLADARCWSAVQ